MNDGSISREVVLFPGALGDLLLALPALRMLRRRQAATGFTLAVAGWLRALAPVTGVADAYASLDDADTAGLFGGTRVPAWFGRRPRVHAWLGARDPAVRARIAALAAAAEFFTIERGNGAGHAAFAYVRQLGLHVAPDELAALARVAPPPSPAAERVCARLARPLLLLHAGAGSRAKRWTRAGFAGVARHWRAAVGGDVVELVGPAEGDDAPLDARAHRVAGWSLVDVAALLASVDAYVGNDSGVSHLAGAVGAAGVVVFGPTAAHRWRPLAERLLVVQGAGDGADGIPLESVDVDAVVRLLTPARPVLDNPQSRT